MKKIYFIALAVFALFACSKDVNVDEMSQTPQTKAPVNWRMYMQATFPNNGDWLMVPKRRASYTLYVQQPSYSDGTTTVYAQSGTIQLSAVSITPSGEQPCSFITFDKTSVDCKEAYVYFTVDENTLSQNRRGYIVATYGGVSSRREFSQLWY